MFVLNKRHRERLRIQLKYDKRKCLNFVYNYMGTRHLKKKYYFGYGCKNLIIVVNDKTCFKFPFHKEQAQLWEKEKAIVDSFSSILHVKMPKIQIIKQGDMCVKKYDFIDGVTIDCADRELVKKNVWKIANQLVDFIFAMADSNPSKLKSFVPKHSKKPGFLYGWGHNDIGGNFILNPKTMDIIGFIDWENAGYGDIMPDLAQAIRYWNKMGYTQLGIEVIRKYTDKYIKHISSKK